MDRLPLMRSSLDGWLVAWLASCARALVRSAGTISARANAASAPAARVALRAFRRRVVFGIMSMEPPDRRLLQSVVRCNPSFVAIRGLVILKISVVRA